MKKKELIFYMMHELKCVVCYLQLWICFFSSTLRKKDLNAQWLIFSQTSFLLWDVFVCLHSRQCPCCLLCHSLFNPWPTFSQKFIKMSKWFRNVFKYFTFTKLKLSQILWMKTKVKLHVHNNKICQPHHSDSWLFIFSTSTEIPPFQSQFMNSYSLKYTEILKNVKSVL